MTRSIILSLLMLTSFWATARQHTQFDLVSPDGKLKTTITVGETVSYSVSHDGDLMLADSRIGITLENGAVWGKNAKVLGSKRATVNQTVAAPFYKKSTVADAYNELSLRFKGDYAIVFRAYDAGIAYRFVSTKSQALTVANEQAEFNFTVDSTAYIPYANATGSYERQFRNSFESLYHVAPLSDWQSGRLGILPLLVSGVKGKKVCITEADLLNYPGMYLEPAKTGHALQAVYAPVPKTMQQGGHNELQELVVSREPYIAKFAAGQAQFPWRIVVVSQQDSQLADNDLVFLLASSNRLNDLSWIRPGKVMWDWWNDWNIDGVPFRSGVNNDTYKYYIDAAATIGVEYVILDEGWAVNKKADLMQVVPAIDLQELCAYAKSKNIGLILWAGYYAFNRDMETVCKHYSEMGVKGFKVDFMDRDDQLMVDFYRRAAEMAAKYHLMLDFHGAYKPTGLSRTYPNVLNYEGVFGLEQMKWDSKADMVEYDVTIPFIRMLAGSMDYTQGAMRNATKNNYHAVYNEPMSQGTRCRQLAEYVVFESPLNMMCDAPSNYLRERECADFIAAVPTVWDETKVLDGSVGKYIHIARRSGTTWYVGGINGWRQTDATLDLSTILGSGEWQAELFRDGANAHRAARDYVKESYTFDSAKPFKVHLAPGGGYALKLTRK